MNEDKSRAGTFGIVCRVGICVIAVYSMLDDFALSGLVTGVIMAFEGLYPMLDDFTLSGFYSIYP